MLEYFQRRGPVTTALTLVFLFICVSGVQSEEFQCVSKAKLDVLVCFDFSQGMCFTEIAKNYYAGFASSLFSSLNSTEDLGSGAGVAFCKNWPYFSGFVSAGTAASSVSMGIGATDCCNGRVLYDTIYNGVHALAFYAPAARPHVLIVISSADDQGSSQSKQAVINRLNQVNLVHTFLIDTGNGSSAFADIASQAKNTRYYNLQYSQLKDLIPEIRALACENHYPTAEISISPKDLYLYPPSEDEFKFWALVDDFEDSPNEMDCSWTFKKPDGSVYDVKQGKSTDVQKLVFTDQVLQLGSTWSVDLKVKDKGGATATATKKFKIFGSTPELAAKSTPPTGVVDAKQILKLEAWNSKAQGDTDKDGGKVSFVWEVIDKPASGSMGGSAPWHQRVWSMNTSEADITLVAGQETGVWRFKCTGTDNEGESSEIFLTVHVRNVPPEIQLSGSSKTSEGNQIQVKTSVLTDKDGGDLSFDWIFVQKPEGGQYPLGSSLGDGPAISLPTSEGDAGTWILELTATDNEGEETKDEFQVHVDAPPEAMISTAVTIGTGSLPLVLDGGNSIDPDSPCPASESYCHLTLGNRSVKGVQFPGIASYGWFVLDVPYELSSDIGPGRVDEVFGVSAVGKEVTLGATEIEAGTWTFQLRVTDHEGNEDYEEVTVKVIDESSPPVVAFGPVERFNVDALGQVDRPVVLSGKPSFDPDNALVDDSVTGIVDFEWTIADSPDLCEEPELSVAGSEATLYTPDDITAFECQGIWSLDLTVEDDEGQKTSGETMAILGNCPSTLCIDYPTETNYQYVEHHADTDTYIYYHLDSALYDVLFAGYVLLEVFHESDESIPFYSAIQSNVLPSNAGGYLAFHWNGLGDDSEIPPYGIYSIRLTLLDVSLAPVATAYEPDAIFIETIDLRVADNSPSLEEKTLDEPLTLSFPYEVLSGFPDEIRWTVTLHEVQGGETHSEGVVTPSISGEIVWTLAKEKYGGRYEITLEVYKDGYFRGASEPHEFIVYTVMPKFDRLVLVNNDDDNHNGVADLAEIVEKDDDILMVVPLDMFGAKVPGSFRLTGTDLDLIRIFDSKQQSQEILPPADLPGNAGPYGTGVDLYIEGLSPGVAALTAEWMFPPGTVRKKQEIKVYVADIGLVEDSDNDKVITASDQAVKAVKIGNWEDAYTGDPNDPVLNGSGVDNFIDFDPSRVYVRVDNPGADVDNQTIDFTMAEISTEMPDSSLFDNVTPIRLTETAPNSGVFVSPSQLLVTRDLPSVGDPAADDQFLVNDGQGLVIGDDDLNDRTHKSVPRGRLTIGYDYAEVTNSHGFNTRAFPLCSDPSNELKRLTVRTLVLNEPYLDDGLDGQKDTGDFGEGDKKFTFTDIDGNKRHDVNEPCEPFMNLSVGDAGSYDVVGEWGGVVDDDFLDLAFYYANAVWAQACIEIVEAERVYVDSPILATGDVQWDGKVTDDEGEPLADSLGLGKSTDILDICYVGVISGATAGYATLPTIGTERSYVYIEAISDSLKEDGVTKSAGNVPVSATGNVLAHEIGHILENSGNEGLSLYLFYPTSLATDLSSIDQSRRLTVVTIDRCRTHRDPGKSGFGNPYLKVAP